MTKQFTIPCQFGQQTSPVTFYIGHPDNGHHPIHFQSNWLSSSKGGTVPQDLMMTLQKLHDLALENNADFEELCYYALISATQNSNGDGVSEGEITSYADEYLKKELNGEIDSKEQSIETIADGSKNNNVEVGGAEDDANNNQQSSAMSNENNQNNTNIATEKQTQDDVVMENNNGQQLQVDDTDTNNAVNNNTINKAKVMPSLNTDAKKTEETTANNSDNEAFNEDLLEMETDLFDDDSTTATNNKFETVSQTNDNANEDNNTDDDILMDDDLLLDDDKMFNDDNIETMNGDGSNKQMANKDNMDSEYDDLLDDDIIFDDDDDNNGELPDDFIGKNNDNKDADISTENEDDLVMDDDLMDFGK